MSNNLHPILLIQFDIFKHEEKEWNKIILVYQTCIQLTYRLYLTYLTYLSIERWSGIK